MVFRLATFILAAVCANLACAEGFQSYFEKELARCDQLINSSAEGEKLEGVKRLSSMKQSTSEGKLLPLLQEESMELKREVIMALGRLGTARAIPPLIACLDSESWEIRQDARLALRSLTGQEIGDNRERWENWWKDRPIANRLLEAARNEAPPKRAQLLRLARSLSSAAEERRFIELLQSANPPLNGSERILVCETLERIGGTNSIPQLAAQKSDAAAWALGTIGGPDAEAALLAFPQTPAVMLNLDRLHSTKAGAFLPHLISSFGLLTYRAHPDDIYIPEPQPVQQVAGNLILRSGLGPVFIEATIRGLEATMNPPIIWSNKLDVPADLAGVLQRMRDELKPGFVRGDGETTSQPLPALVYVCSQRALIPRLRTLLKHPAVLPRIYIAMLLGKLQADEAIPQIISIIDEGYPFSDSTALASGKHFDQSQTIRWRGFLCMALGKFQNAQARLALERFATDLNKSRDIRYGAVVGLGYLLNPASKLVLEQVIAKDPIWMIREEARETICRIERRSRDI